MLIDTLTVSRAASMLYKDDNGGWSYAGAYALCEYLDQLSDDIGDPIEFDPVAFRCDFSEYASLVDWARNYHGDTWPEMMGIDTEDDTATEDDIDNEIRAYIEDHGTLIEFDGGIIVSAF